MTRVPYWALLRLPALFLLILVNLAPSPLAGQGVYNQQAAQLVGKAAELSKEGNFDGAAELYRQAIGISPQDPMLYFYLGLALENKGSYPEASQSYEKAISMQQAKKTMPNSLLANLYLHSATAFIMMNHADEASARVDKALEINPNSADALSTKGIILDIQGHLDEAIAYDGRAFDMKPGFANYAENLAPALEKKGDAKGAVAVLETALKSNPKDPDLLASMATPSSRSIIRRRPSGPIKAVSPGIPIIPRCSTISPTPYAARRNYPKHWNYCGKPTPCLRMMPISL